MPLMISTPLKQLIGLALCTSVSFTFSSCNTDDDDQLEVPTTYEFSRDGSSTVDYSGQIERLDMLAQITTYLKTSNTVGAPALDANTLENMFNNENDPFGQVYEKNLSSKCFSSDVPMFLQFLNEAASISQATGTASNGTAGVLVEGGSDPIQGYRVNENGLELIQLVEKGLMGAIFYYQAMEVYLSQDRMSTIGNDDFVEGKNYTNMEHYLDEAFGYFGAPVDFPSIASLEDARFWAKYCNTRNEGLYSGINNEIATAFRTARSGITAKDYEARDEAIQTIMDKWSVVVAATAVGYLNQALSTSGTAEYRRHHVMSEAIGFMLALKYHFNGGNSKFPPRYTYSHVEEALVLIGTNTNLYTLTDNEIEEAINHIKMAFPSGEIK
jgi:hypothetical protein